MAIGEVHELVLVAAFQYGGIGADIENVARDLGLYVTHVAGIVNGLYNNGDLNNGGSGGTIIFNLARQQGVRELEQRYLSQALQLPVDELRVLLALKTTDLRAKELANVFQAERSRIDDAIAQLISSGLVVYPHPRVTPDARVSLTTKGRLFAILIRKAKPPTLAISTEAIARTSSVTTLIPTIPSVPTVSRLRLKQEELLLILDRIADPKTNLVPAYTTPEGYSNEDIANITTGLKNLALLAFEGGRIRITAEGREKAKEIRRTSKHNQQPSKAKPAVEPLSSVGLSIREPLDGAVVSHEPDAEIVTSEPTDRIRLFVFNITGDKLWWSQPVPQRYTDKTLWRGRVVFGQLTSKGERFRLVAIHTVENKPQSFPESELPKGPRSQLVEVQREWPREPDAKFFVIAEGDISTTFRLRPGMVVRSDEFDNSNSVPHLLGHGSIRVATPQEISDFDKKFPIRPDEEPTALALADLKRHWDMRIATVQKPSQKTLVCFDCMRELQDHESNIRALITSAIGRPPLTEDGELASTVHANRRMRLLIAHTKIFREVIKVLAEPIMIWAEGFPDLPSTPFQNYIDNNGENPYWVRNEFYTDAESFLKRLRLKLLSAEQQKIPSTDFEPSTKAARPIDPGNIVEDMLKRVAGGEDRAEVLKAVSEVAKPISVVRMEDMERWVSEGESKTKKPLPMHTKPPKKDEGKNWLSVLWNGLLQSAKIYTPNKFAIGLVGIAFALAIIIGVLRSYLVAVVGVPLTIAAMIFLWFVKGMVDGKKKPSHEAKAIVWVVIVVFSLLLFCLFTAFAFDWPSPLARKLGGSAEPRHYP